MATPISPAKIVGRFAGGGTGLGNLTNVSIANAFRNIGKKFTDVGIGAQDFNGFVFSGGTQAVNAVTLSSFVTTNTVTLNGVVLTGETTPTAGSNVQFKIGASDTATAVNLAALINSLSAPAKILGVVTATSSGAVVTITAVEAGAIGNLYTLAISANGSVTGATFASGADGTITFLAKGL